MMKAQKEGKKNTNMSSKSTVQDAISHWQSALAETKQVSETNLSPSLHEKHNNNEKIIKKKLLYYNRTCCFQAH